MKLILIAVNSYWHYISWLLLTSVDVSRYIRNTEKMCKATDQNHHGSGKQCGHSGRRGFSLRYNVYCTLDARHFDDSSPLVRLARDLRTRRDQMERLVQKNIFPSSGNELPMEGRRDSREGGRRKETNMAAGDSASQPASQHQVGDDSYSWMTAATAG